MRIKSILCATKLSTFTTVLSSVDHYCLVVVWPLGFQEQSHMEGTPGTDVGGRWRSWVQHMPSPKPAAGFQGAGKQVDRKHRLHKRLTGLLIPSALVWLLPSWCAHRARAFSCQIRVCSRSNACDLSKHICCPYWDLCQAFGLMASFLWRVKCYLLYEPTVRQILCRDAWKWALQWGWHGLLWTHGSQSSIKTRCHTWNISNHPPPSDER